MTQNYTKQTITADGLVGELYIPEGDGPFPGVICIGGSGGGVGSEAAPLFAEAGFVALSLGYFGAPGLPETFAHLPLEYFEKAVEWVLSQPIVCGPKVGVTGTSRGSEAALQLATLTSKIGGVVAYVPSGIRWNGVDGLAPWMYKGEALPFVQRLTEFGHAEAGSAIAKVDMYNRVLDKPQVYETAEIVIEKAACPILLLSGKDDQLWPSERMAELIIRRLEQHKYSYPYRHISYPDAGHRVKVPGLDRSRYEPVSEDTVTHEVLQLGGTYEGNKAASEKAWGETVRFFRSVLD